MVGVWQGLLANMAVVVAVVTLWSNLREPIRHLGHRYETISFGLMMSGGAVLAMILAVQVWPGVLFDLRVPPLAAAGFFGGPLAATLAAGLALLYRIGIGGDGAVSGCCEILAVAILATVTRSFVGDRAVRSRDVMMLAAVTTLADLASFLTLPPPLIVPTLEQMGLPTASLDLIGVTLAGLSILGEERRNELVRSNALYRGIIEALPDCLNVKDLAGRFLAANPATARLMRAPSVDALIGKTDFDFYPEATARGFRDDEVAAMSSMREMTVEQRCVFADGGNAWLSTLKAPFHDERGEVVGLITHNRDVTTTKLMQLQLNSVRQHLAAALANMADGLVMYDAEGQILICNAPYQATFPLTADLRIVGARLPDILRQSVARGEEALPTGVDIDTWIETILVRIRAGGDRIIALRDGRCIEARTRPLSEGGSLTMFSDVTARRREEETLRHRAEHDPLTGLANRAAFEVRLAEMHARTLAHGGAFAVMLLDLDRFKQVNDRFGHQVGDHLLINVSRRLEAACRHGDVVARLGGDEFAIVSEGHAAEVGAPRLAKRILEGLALPFEVDEVVLWPSASIGYTIFPHDPSPPDTLVLHADRALYAAKAAGRCRSVAYGVDFLAVAAQ